jgi:hypothetical protein
MEQVQEALPWLDQHGLTVVCLLLGGFFLLWRLASKVVRWGWFLLYFVGAFGFLLAAGWLQNGSAPDLSVPLSGAFAFASMAMAIRAKILRAVSALALLAVVYVLSATNGVDLGGWISRFGSGQ